MKTALLTSIAAATMFVNAYGETRTVTLTTASNAVAVLQVQEFERAKIVHAQGDVFSVTVTKNSLQFPYDYLELKGWTQSAGYTPPKSIVVAGPAEIKLQNESAAPALVSIEVEPAAYPPDKTIILPPSTNQFNVTLETSTNLVQWMTSTNSIYGRPDEARFFRIKMEKLN